MPPRKPKPTPGANLPWPVIVLACCVLPVAVQLAACASGRIGLDHVEPPVAYRHNTVNVLSDDTLGNATETTLRRLGLREAWERDRSTAIAQLHDRVAAGNGGDDDVFALAELSYFQGMRLSEAARPASAPRRFGKSAARFQSAREAPRHHAVSDVARPHFLAAAIYAYAFLFSEGPRGRIDALDPRLRVAADLYAAAIAHAFANARPGGLQIAAGRYPLPFGAIDVSFDQEALRWGKRTLDDFRWSGSFNIAGLRNHYRQPGIGVPVAARTKLPDGHFDFVSPDAWVPATVLLEIPEPRRQLRGSELRGVLDIQTADERASSEIGGQQFPLQTDPSSALAATLEESRFWESELARFLGRAIGLRPEGALSAQEPYVGDKIPAVFVHGTDSSPATWANMVNDLQYDQRIHDRYHFWFFRYDSGSPIMYSSMLLRRALAKAVAELAADHRSNCLDDMIVIGHSQGGLLTKLTAVETGSHLWDAYYRVPIEEVDLRKKARDLLQEMAFLHPLPFVRRLVFIATPHRGSYLASYRIAQRLASRLIRLPGDVLEIGTDIAGLGRYSRPGVIANRMPTSIDNMSPNNAFVRAVAEIPVVDDVPYHSIIALRPGESRQTGGDGVVKFASAQVDGAASELVVASGHTTLSNPATIEEVRRILELHAASAACAPAASD